MNKLQKVQFHLLFISRVLLDYNLISVIRCKAQQKRFEIKIFIMVNFHALYVSRTCYFNEVAGM